MAAMARCRVCKAEFALARLLDDWNCRCPCCDSSLAHDGPTRARILRKAAAVDRLEAQLVDDLSDIAGIDSNIELSVGPIVARLLCGVAADVIATTCDDGSCPSPEEELT